MGQIERLSELPISESNHSISYAKDGNEFGIWLGGLWWGEKDIPRLELAICDFKKMRGIHD